MNLQERCFGPITQVRKLRLALYKDLLRVTQLNHGKPRTRIWISLSLSTFPTHPELIPTIEKH